MTDYAFELLSSTSLPSLDLELRYYRHGLTGARHFHMASSDRNNAFTLTVPTLPQDSTGVAHILEHTTLCGSRRFPVRDPFFMMDRRSLNTFMNAYTGSDSTTYLFATRNRQDFDNLLAVYLDAVFFPLLDPLDFAQEGCRLEVGGEDTSGPERLEYHGVVFNEMKGAMSSAVAQLWQHIHFALFPDTVYRHNSGGDPLVIPDLKFETLEAFHRKFYHPSNAVFMTYGCFREEEHQKHFVELVLEHFTSAEQMIVSDPQDPFDSLREVETMYAVDEVGRRRTHVAWAWVLGECADADNFVEAHFLSSFLLEHSASPLQHYLETTELANAPSELCGIDDSTRNLIFMCGVEGAESGSARDLQDGVWKVLESCCSETSDITALEATIDRLEMEQRDLGNGTFPFGLQLMGRILPAAMYRRAPEPLLDLGPALTKLRRAISNPGFVADLIRRSLLENTHSTRVVMSPDAAKAERDLAEEQQQLEHLKGSMTRGDLDALEMQTNALRARQSQDDNTEILPSVTLADVSDPAADRVAKIDRQKEVEVFNYECGTNGIFRIQVVLDIPSIPTSHLKALPLFCEYLTELGHDDDNYMAVQSRRALTGSFSAHVIARADVNDRSEVAGWVVIAGKSLARKRDETIKITTDMLRGVRFDEHERLRELIEQSRAETEQSIPERGHQLAVATAANAFSPGAALDDFWDGPTAIRYLQGLGRRATEGGRLDDLFRVFNAIRSSLFSTRARVLLIGEEGALDGAADLCNNLAYAGAPSKFLVPNIPTPGETNGWAITSLVNFCAKAYPAPAEHSEDAAALTVLGRYLQDGFLHNAIREQGGAYGSGAGYDPGSCVFRFFSYRDPRALNTLSDFDRAIEWFSTQHDQKRLEESLLGVIRALDQPRSPAGEAERAFFDMVYGRDMQSRKSFRERILGSTHEQLRQVAAKYLIPSSGRVGILSGSGSESDFEGSEVRFGKL